MPLLFSYGTLQREEVQRSTFGRRLDGQSDALPGYEPSRIPIGDPEIAARFGKTHHDNVKFHGDEGRRVAGMVFEITDAELARADQYEAEYFYHRVATRLASGRQAWVYVHGSQGGGPAPRRPGRSTSSG